MATFLSAHGYDPGPSQRPLLAGAISGILATIPALPILVWLGSLKVEAAILHLSPLVTILAGCAALALAGAAYGRIFGRAANNPHGGWLFGMVFAFALWAGGAVLVIPLASGGRAPAGEAALGVVLSMLVWGLATGILLPFVHRPLHESLKKASRHADVGPDAAAGKTRQLRNHARDKRG
jgi:4-amino-4-deoxy-L-arabinose transferase-like glycosyltransferase